MKENLIPYSIGDQQLLRLTSCQDVGNFRKIFSNYDLNRVNSQIQKLVQNGLGLKFITSVTGTSLLNRSQRMNLQTSQWNVGHDIIFTGASNFEPIVPIYVSVLLRYALYLNKETEAVVLGFYIKDDSAKPILTVFNIQTDLDLQQATKRLFDYIKGRFRIQLKILIPVDLRFIEATITLNMHLYTTDLVAGYQSLYPVNTLQDVAKVFFTVDDFELWT